MHIHRLSADEALSSLKTTPAGILETEAARRLAEFGPNHVEELGREHLLIGFAREFTHFFAIILWAGATLAFVAEHFESGQGMARLGAAIVGVIVINGIFSFWQEYKAERAVVYATGMRTEFGKIAHLTQTTGEASSPLQREIARLSRIVAALATGIGVTMFFIGQALGLPTWENLLFAIGIIVANVPERLLRTVTLSLAMATQRMAKRNALVHHLPAVEALGSTTAIRCDKTGTLTQNRMSVRRLWLGGGFVEPEDVAAQPRLVQDNRQLFVNAALCHNLNEVDDHGQRKLLGDPMEVALAALGRQAAGGLAGFFAALMWTLEEARKAWLRRTVI